MACHCSCQQLQALRLTCNAAIVTGQRRPRQLQPTRQQHLIDGAGSPRNLLACSQRYQQRSRLVQCQSSLTSATLSGLTAAGFVYSLCLALSMLVAPWHAKTLGVVKSNLIFVPLSVLYLLLLINSWSPDTMALMMPGSLDDALAAGTFAPQWFPKVEGIMTLFARVPTVASFCTHILMINLFLARTCLLDGLKHRIPTFHTVLCASLLGPLGLLCHIMTKGGYALAARVLGRDPRGEEPVVEVESQGGKITLAPYS